MRQSEYNEHLFRPVESDAMLAKYVLSAFAALPLLAANANAQDAPKPTPSATPTWSYDGENDNQERWGDLSVDFSLCLLGLNQSPINIAYTEVKDLPKIVPNYKLSPAHVQYKDNALIVTIDGQNKLKIGTQSYRLTHLAFHSPGDHFVLGQFFYAEIQFYHVDKKGNPLVLSTFVKVTSKPNETLDVILQHMPHKKAEIGKAYDIEIDPTGLLPEKRGYYSYKGSLTTPPCTENVEWRILKSPVELTELQLKSLARYLGRNGRMQQPVYNRTILESKD
ncbi:MAG: hypothetical protein EBR02_05960 [Alphaproteobacteria bacterium]|nr:hypothetical protein [Alphaproteobacteria bacterium]